MLLTGAVACGLWWLFLLEWIRSQPWSGCFRHRIRV